MASGGKIVILEDDSIWKVAVVDRIDTVLWLPIEPIILCDSKMIKTANGDRVSVTRVE